jgi:hypothetical protein
MCGRNAVWPGTGPGAILLNRDTAISTLILMLQCVQKKGPGPDHRLDRVPPVPDPGFNDGRRLNVQMLQLRIPLVGLMALIVLVTWQYHEGRLSPWGVAEMFAIYVGAVVLSRAGAKWFSGSEENDRSPK